MSDLTIAIFNSSASVFSLYFAALSILIVFREKKEFIPSSIHLWVVISIAGLLVSCCGSLVSMIVYQFNCFDMTIYSAVWASFFIVGIMCMVVVLKQIMSRF